MGFITPGISPGAGGATTAASLDAALTAARASASSGDLYEDTSTGRVYAYLDEGPGLLVPADVFDVISGYVSNASGDAYVQTSDAEADFVARGWVAAESGTGSVSKVAGADCVLTTGGTGAGAQAKITFAPTTYPSRLAIMARVSSYADDGVNTTRFIVRDNVKDLRLGLEASNVLTLHSSGTTVGGGRVTTDGNAFWIFCMIDLSSANGVQYLVNLSDPTRQMRASVQSDLSASTTEVLGVFAGLSARAATAFINTAEVHFLGVSAP
jgi:hypothetical protein